MSQNNRPHIFKKSHITLLLCRKQIQRKQDTIRVMQTMKGHQLENIITRFYYKQKELYFQIILQLRDKKVIYSEYNDYSKYKMQLQQLLNIKETNGTLHFNPMKLQDTNYAVV